MSRKVRYNEEIASSSSTSAIPVAVCDDTSAITLLPIVFIDALSYSVVLALLPFGFGDEVKSASVGGLLVSIQALFAAVSGPVLGVMSDRFGRNRVIAISLCGLAISYLLLASSQTLFSLALSRCLAGSMAGNLSVIQAALVASVEVDRRTERLSQLNATWLIGFVVGPGAVALIAGLGYSPIRWIAGGAALAAAALSLSFGIVAVNGATRQAKSSPRGDRPKLSSVEVISHSGAWLGVLFIIALCQTGLAATIGYWAVERLGWDLTEVSLWRMWTSACVLVASLRVPRLVAPFLDNGRFATVLLVIAGVGALTFLLPIGAAAALIGGPCLYGAIYLGLAAGAAGLADRSAPDTLGATMGLAQSATALGRVIGPVLFGWLLHALSPAYPFALIAALMMASITIVWGFGYRCRPDEQAESQ